MRNILTVIFAALAVCFAAPGARGQATVLRFGRLVDGRGLVVDKTAKQ